MLRFMGLQRVGHNRATEMNGTEGLSSLPELPLLEVTLNLVSSLICILHTEGI